jgi:hypothetical protein
MIKITNESFQHTSGVIYLLIVTNQSNHVDVMSRLQCETVR